MGRRSSDPKDKTGRVTVVAGALTLLASGWIGGGPFAGSFVMFPLFLAICSLGIGFGGLAVWAYRGGIEAILFSVALLLLSPLFVGLGLRYGDQVTFYAWAATHIPLVRDMSGRGQVREWSSRGMAGMTDFSYLVVDPTDTLSDPEAAARWSKKAGFDCPIMHTSRLWPRFYMLVTDNCAVSILTLSLGGLSPGGQGVVIAAQ